MINYRKKYLRTKQVALMHYKALIQIALKERNAELFRKYQDKYEQMRFEYTKGLVG